MSTLQMISSISQILIIPLLGVTVRWIIQVERRLSRIEGYCKGRSCAEEEENRGY